MSVVALIPARYNSSRLPGKPLKNIQGKSMIQRVCMQCKKSGIFDAIVVATDDKRICDHVRALGFDSVMTKIHSSGTSRCAEAIEKLEGDYDFVINVQGDEPFIHTENLKLIYKELMDKKNNYKIVTLAKLINFTEELRDPNVVKIVINQSQEAIYFSRGLIPFCLFNEKEFDKLGYSFYKHIGVYGFSSDKLGELVKLPESMIRKVENLEQLDWLYYGHKIKVLKTLGSIKSIDTLEDLEDANINFSTYAR